MSDTAKRPRETGDQIDSTDRFRAFAEAAPIGMVEVDLEGSVLWANDRWRQITGLHTPGPISYQQLQEITHPDDRDRLSSQYLKAAKTLSEYDLEARVVRDDGSVIRVRIQGAPVLGPDGQPRGFSGTVQDITEFHEATEARRRSEQRYRDLVDKAPVGQAVYLLDGTMVEVNRAWADLLGYQPEEILGSKASHFAHPEDLEKSIEIGQRLLSGELESYSSERRLFRKDGSQLWVASSIRLERDLDGNPLHFHTLIIDISQSKLATDALRESEARYRRLIDEAPIGQVISRTDGTLVEVNRAFVDLMASSRAELFSRNPADLFHPEDIAPLATQVQRLLNGEIDFFETERRLMRPDGSIVWVAGGTTLIEQRGTYYLHSVMQDITERKLAEDALKQSEERYRAVIEALHDGVLVQNMTRLEAANNAAMTMSGMTLAQLGDPATYEAMDPIDRDGNYIPLRKRGTVKALTEGRAVLNQVAGLIVKGERRWFNFNAVPRIHDGEIVGAVTTFSDITDRKLAEDALRGSEERFRTLAESLPVGVFQSDGEMKLQYVNPRWVELTQIPERDAIGDTGIGIIHLDDLDRVVKVFTKSIQENRPYHAQYRIVTPSGETRWVSAYGAPTMDPETGQLSTFIGSIEDISPLISAQEETSRLAGIVESTSDLVELADFETGQLIYLNKAARELFGYSDRDVTGIGHLELFQPEAVDLWFGAVAPALERGETWSGELPMKAADGGTVHVWQTLAVKRRSDGTIYQLSAVGRDVTERRRFEAVLAHQATHDALTDLPNRALLLDHLDLALARAQRDGRQVGVLFLDLDRFKLVNDSHGHETGDQLLIGVAERISEVLRPADTVARLGGDEFVVLCEDVIDEHHAVAIAQRVLAVIEGKPFPIDNIELSISGSLGIALSPGGPDAHGEGLLRDADAAMYRAKDLGRARLELFDESMRKRAAQRMELAEQLASSIEQGNIVVYFQPCVNLNSGHIVGVEALARWEHPTRGLLSPYEFIGLAEETGLIVGLGLRVLTHACVQGRRWQDRLGAKAPRVHVNLSARQLVAANLPLLVKGVLDSSGLDPSLLCLEITESVLMEDAPTVIEMLRQLKELGVFIAIDDFGTGYSSLSYLRRFPVDVLKVDQSFVDGLGPDPEDSAIVAAIISLARTLELEAVAEGVETPEQLALLRSLGCTSGQGFHFAKPVPVEEFDAMLDQPFVV